MPNVGPLEIAVVLVIVLIIFGPKRLPELGQAMGRGIRQFKSSLSGDDDDKDSPEEKKRELQASQQAQASQPQPPQAAAESPAEPVEGEIVTENKA
jgi:sec-independent protein translocase protein TatA